MFEEGDIEFLDQDAELKKFEKVIALVYNETIGQDLEMHVDSLTMLTFIETKLEELLNIEEHMPPSMVKERANII